MITNDALSDVLNRVEEANAGQPLTFFESTTAAAFLAFAETPADLLLLETGLGGLHDATNIVLHPKLTLITAIDYDHQAFLGNELSQIAREKAGIFKRGTPAISARQNDEARAALERQALKLSVQLDIMGEGFDAMNENGRLVFQDENALLDLALPRLAGEHQVGNAGVAIKAARMIGLTPEAIDKGLQTAVWPGRLQAIKAGPLHGLLRDPASEVWLDGGHNPHAAVALRRFIDSLQQRDLKPLTIICGLINTKDPGDFFAAFGGLDARFHCVPFSSDAMIPPDDLAAAAKAKGLDAMTASSPSDVIAHLASGPQRVLICGSLYLAGDVLALSEETWPT